MPRIKIKDLPRDRELGKADLKKVFGGVPNTAPLSDGANWVPQGGAGGLVTDPTAMPTGVPNAAPVG